MNIKVHKEYFEDGQLWMYVSICEKRSHGERILFHEDGQRSLPKEHFFNIYNKAHGEYLAYDEEGELEQHDFYLNNRLIRIPFLPSKPLRIPFKSNKTRFQTLEIL